MNYRKVLGCLLCILHFWGIGYSQDNIRANYGCADIEGIVLGAHPSLEQMKKCFGENYTVEHIIVDEVGPYDLMVYKFEGVELSIDSGKGLISFVLKSNKYHSLISYGIDDGVTVGDLWDIFLNAGYPIHSMYESNINDKDEKKYNLFFWMNGILPDTIVTMTVKNDIIIEIYVWPNDA